MVNLIGYFHGDVIGKFIPMRDFHADSHDKNLLTQLLTIMTFYVVWIKENKSSLSG